MQPRCCGARRVIALMVTHGTRITQDNPENRRRPPHEAYEIIAVVGRDQMARTEGQVRHIMWAATLITAATIVSRLLGFFRASLIADLFGQTATVDHYNAAYVLPDTLYLLLIGGAISSAFVPVIAGLLTRGKADEAERVLNAALTTVVAGLVPALLLAELIAPYIVRVVAVGFNGNPAAIEATTHLTRIMLVAVLFHGLNGV